MSPEEIQQKRDGLELLQGMADEQTRKAIIRTFEGQLSDYVFALLSPEISDGEALTVRAKAIGLVETLDAMGVKISSVAHAIPIRRATESRVRQAIDQ